MVDTVHRAQDTAPRAQERNDRDPGYAWIALSVCAALYLIGVFRLPHDEPVEHVGVMRMLLGSIFFGLALYA